MDGNVCRVDDIDHTRTPWTTYTVPDQRCNTEHKRDRYLLTSDDAFLAFMEDQGACAMTAAPAMIRTRKGFSEREYR